jgi:hypothetical protein
VGKIILPVYQGGFGFNASYKGFSLMLPLPLSRFYRFDIDYQGLMDIRNAELFAVSYS